jgi:hypothetical protein
MVAIANHRRKHPPTPMPPATMTPGEIVWVEGGGVRAVAVLGLPRDHEGREWRNIIVGDNLTEMATDLDLIVRRPGSYDVTIYAELVCQVWADQVIGHLDQLDDATFDGIQFSLATDGESLADLEHGPLPLSGPADPRWRHRGDMLTDVLMPLREDCLGTLWDAL